MAETLFSPATVHSAAYVNRHVGELRCFAMSKRTKLPGRAGYEPHDAASRGLDLEIDLGVIGGVELVMVVLPLPLL